ncbi:MAG: hypothetical protein Pars92KO_04770 [Parasphingorhabdus sp.]
MPKKRKENVSVSFHYMVRPNKDKKADGYDEISVADFDGLCDVIEKQPKPDTTDPKTLERLRFGTLIPFANFKRMDARCVFGTFEAPYSGHSFKNSEKGKIEANSVNQRQFHYCLYLSGSGRLYVGSQYLGPYGSYLDLKLAIKRFMKNGSSLIDFAIRDDSLALSKVVPKEIQIDVSNASDEIHRDQVLGRKTAIVLKRDKKGGDFEAAARDRILPIFNSKSKDRAKELAKTLNDLGMFSVEEGEITDGKMVIEKGRGQQTIYLFEPLNFATKYNLDVPLNSDGHPKTKAVRKAIYKALEQNIIFNAGK